MDFCLVESKETTSRHNFVLWPLPCVPFDLTLGFIYSLFCHFRGQPSSPFYGHFWKMLLVSVALKETFTYPLSLWLPFPSLYLYSLFLKWTVFYLSDLSLTSNSPPCCALFPCIGISRAHHRDPLLIMPDEHVFHIYIISPLTHQGSHLSLSRCFFLCVPEVFLTRILSEWQFRLASLMETCVCLYHIKAFINLNEIICSIQYQY